MHDKDTIFQRQGKVLKNLLYRMGLNCIFTRQILNIFYNPVFMKTCRVYFLLLLPVLSLALCSCATTANTELPEGFGYVHEAIPEVVYDIRYHGYDNFLGRPVDGYLEPVAILTNEAIEALSQAADDLADEGYGIIVFDGYRPQKAVDHFVRWAKAVNDTLTKARFYPDVDKADLFSLGYIAERSGHSRGSTVDLTLFYLETGEELDMGSGFDFFGPISNHGTNLITQKQADNRMILRDVMLKHGFLLYEKEWWHYTLSNEPFPDTYFDFDVQ